MTAEPSAKPERVFDPRGSQVLGPTAFGRLYDKSRDWARRQLQDWWEEQEAGGEMRVGRRPDGSLFTTIAVVRRTHPAGRDMALVRRVEGLERDLTQAYRRLDALTTRVGELEQAWRDGLGPIGKRRS